MRNYLRKAVFATAFAIGLSGFNIMNAALAGESDANAALQATVISTLLGEAASSIERGQFEQAGNALERALRINPDDAEIWHLLGQVRLMQSRYDDAVAMAAKAAGLETTDRSFMRRNEQLLITARNKAATPLGDAEIAAVHVEKDQKSIPVVTETKAVKQPIRAPKPAVAAQSSHALEKNSLAVTEPSVDQEDYWHWQQLPSKARLVSINEPTAADFDRIEARFAEDYPADLLEDDQDYYAFGDYHPHFDQINRMLDNRRDYRYQYRPQAQPVQPQRQRNERRQEQAARWPRGLRLFSTF